METNDPKKQKIYRSKSQARFKKKYEQLSPTKKRKNSTEDSENAMIPFDSLEKEHVETSYDIETLQLLLDNKDFIPSKQDQYGNTLLHYAAQNHDATIITALLQDYRVIASIKNHNMQTAREMITKKTNTCVTLRSLIFDRISIETAIKDAIKTYKSVKQYVEYTDSNEQKNISEDKQCLMHLKKKMIESVIKKVSHYHDTQEQKLPTETPDYLTENFLLKLAIYMYENEKFIQ